MKKVLLTTILLSAVAMTASAQNISVTSPTLRNDNLKGPVRAVLTTTVYEVGEGDEYGFFQVENSSYDTVGRLLYSINTSPDGLDDVFTYNYDSLGRLATVDSRRREVYTDTYRYNAAGQLESIEERWPKEGGKNSLNTTYNVVRRDSQGRPLRIEGDMNEDGMRWVYSYEYRADGHTVIQKVEPQGMETRKYYNQRGTLDSAMYGSTKTTFTYNEHGDMTEYRDLNAFSAERITTYSYPEEEWLFDKYGNWTTRYITFHDGSKCFETRTIIYYE